MSAGQEFFEVSLPVAPHDVFNISVVPAAFSKHQGYFLVIGDCVDIVGRSDRTTLSVGVGAYRSLERVHRQFTYVLDTGGERALNLIGLPLPLVMSAQILE